MKVYDIETNSFFEIPESINVETITFTTPVKNSGIIPSHRDDFTLRNIGQALNRFVLPQSLLTKDEIAIILSSMHIDYSDRTHKKLRDVLIKNLHSIERFDAEYIKTINELEEKNKLLSFSKIELSSVLSETEQALESESKVVEDLNYLFSGNIFQSMFRCIKHWLDIRKGDE